MTTRWGLAVALIVLCLTLVSLAEDYYQILGVTRSASEKEIKSAFRQLSKQYHPDKNPGNAEAEAKYLKINTAYEALSDPEKRRIYDQFGEEGLKKGAVNRGGNPFGDFFSMFTGRGRQQQGELRKGPPLYLPLMVTLEDIYLGKTLRVLQRKQVICPHCRGSGADSPDDISTCPVCKGSGVEIVTQKLGPGFVQQMQTTCSKCGGTGKIQTSTCHHCHGTKVETGEHMLTVVVEKGMAEGQEIVQYSEGDQRPGEEPSNVVFTVHSNPHAYFQRQGHDLHMAMRITLLEALVGFTRKVNHLDGHVVTISRSEVTPPSHRIFLQGEGLPVYGDHGNFGRLIVQFFVDFPAVLTEDQKNGFRKLLH